MSNLKANNQQIGKNQSVSKDREDKLKVAKERQKEERQKKIEELKAHAEAAQKYREQKEEERHRRMQETKLKDLEKRQHVEERKKAIMEAEKERREYILRKNQERACRLELKKREQNSLFAFGSSTPRLLEPATFGMVSPSTFWCNRRSTSISNVASVSLTRRSSERDLSTIGSKQRATSANGSDDDKIPDVMFRSVARRKTDLMPTIPIRRDGYYSSRSSLANTPKAQGRAYSMTRLDYLAQPIRRNGEHICSLLERELRIQSDKLQPIQKEDPHRKTSCFSNTSNFRISRSMTHLVEGKKLQKRTTGCRSGSVTPKKTNIPSRPISAMSSSAVTNSSTRRLNSDLRKPRPASIAGTAVSLDEITFSKKKSTSNTASPTSTVSTPKKVGTMMSTSLISYNFSNDDKKCVSDQVPQSPCSTKTLSLRTFSTDLLNCNDKKVNKATSSSTPYSKQIKSETKENDQQVSNENRDIPKRDSSVGEAIHPSLISTNETEKKWIENSDNLHENIEITPLAKNKIITEEEAKAALAERRRLAREEAERQAAAERKRIETEKEMELKQLQEEAEKQRQFEEEAIRLAEEQRKAEAQRLRDAIEDAKKREDEEKRKREEDNRQRCEREEIDKKIKEEAERQRMEVDERLKREEKEREERRKRVEAIMARTRKVAVSTANSKKDLSNDHKRDDVFCPEPHNPIAGSNTKISFDQDSKSKSFLDDSTTETDCINTILSNISTEDELKKDPLDDSKLIDSKKSILNVDKESKNYTATNMVKLISATNGNSHIENLNQNDEHGEPFMPGQTTLFQFNTEENRRNPINFNNNNVITKSLVTETVAPNE